MSMHCANHQESVTSKGLTVVKASGVARLRNNASLLNVILVGFYSKDDYTQDPTVSTLPTFSIKDILFVTGKFRFIEDTDNDERELPILKIGLHSVVHLAISPSNLLAFPFLINMTAVVTNLPRNDPDHDDISFSVETKDFMDQENVDLGLECYHLKSATHLTPTTNSLKKGTLLFMNGELLDKERPKVTDLAIKALNQDQNSEIQNLSIP
ncbi:hypothetical protein C2G38_2175827 [Gigaspora rosea]|uniref:Uncharacterized protein n=1 Tax=Gigaspora rosea TaxID=44941 RepID=A0A397VGV9_9GLOM|nr:hypothetical protein C2G38_2175827 [Gigaspora rosea]